MRNCYLGIDGGGTKTHLMLIDDNKKIIIEDIGGGSNIHSIGIAKVKQNIESALYLLLDKAKIKVSDIKSLCLGSAGLGRVSDKIVWSSIFKELGFSCPLSLVTDSETALFGGLHKREGVVIISGTGSICVGFDKDNNFARSGGWGHILGDEGSAYYISSKMLNAVVKCHDGLGEPTILTNLILKYLSLSNISELVPVIYSYNDKKDIAALAFLIQEGIESKDSVSMSIAEDSALMLAQLVNSVHNKLNLPDEFDLTTGGSVLNNNSYIWQSFKRHVINFLPKVKLHTPLSPPAYGAALIAFLRINPKDSRQ